MTERADISESLLPGKKPTLFALVVVSMVSPIAINIILPSMPAMKLEFDADFSSVQLTLSLYLVSITVAQLILGPLSDRFGRRPVLLAGLFVFIAASFATVLAESIWMVILLRIVQGAGGCSGLVLGRAIIRDVYDRRKSASMLGYVTMALAIGPMISPLLGGFLQQIFDWRAQFYFMALLGLFAFAIAWVDINETNLAPKDAMNIGSMVSDFGQLLGTPSFLLFTLAGSLSAAVFFSFLGGSPYVGTFILDMTPTQFGLWFTLLPIGYSVGNFLTGRYAETLGIRKMILIGSALMTGAIIIQAVLCLGFAISVASLFVPMLLATLSNGLALPSTVAGAISTRPEIAGAASGLNGASLTGAGALFSWLAALLVSGQGSPLPMFMLMVSLAAVALLSAFAIQRVNLNSQ